MDEDHSIDGSTVKSFLAEYCERARERLRGTPFGEDIEWMLSFYDTDRIATVSLDELDAVMNDEPPSRSRH